MRLRWVPRRLALYSLSVFIGFGAARSSSAATYYVQGALSSCSDSGAGTAQAPYCTISAAISRRGGPGVTILVKPGVYREDVRISTDGSSGNPLVVAASGSPVVVDGADDVSISSAWTLHSGNVWRAPGVTWSPEQVFVDGIRLTPSSSAPSSLGTNTFVYVSGQGLYVNIGGSNPGTRQTLVGRRDHGFRLSGVAWVSIDGFSVMHTEDDAIQVTGASANCEITNNTVSFANTRGIQVSSSSIILVQSNVVFSCNDHGIGLSGCTGVAVQENESFDNARPDVRAANGIYLTGSSGNTIQRNRLHDNQDSGLQINSGSNDNLSLQNQSWDNGDHGFDHLESSGTFHLGDVAYRNYKDGFSMEGDSPGTTVANCIAVDNGLETQEYNLWVDDSSTPGFVSNSNIFWNSTSAPIVKFVSERYTSLSAYSSDSGHDGRSLQANPRFVSASSGDFHLLSPSPAIDSADATVTNWPVTDADGQLRYDDANVANTGIGPPVTFADRGAFEYVSASTPNRAPNGTIDTPLRNVTIAAGQNVRFSSTGTDPDGDPLLTYTWSFGGAASNRTVEDPSPVTFPAPGTYTVTLTVRDHLGLADPTPPSLVVTVVPNQAPNGTIDAPAADLTVFLGQSPAFSATSMDPDVHTPFTYAWSFGGGASNRTVEDPGAVAFSTLGTYTVTFTVTDALGLQDPTPDRRVITVIPVNLPPNGVIQSPAASPVSITAGESISFSSSGADPDGHTPLSFLWTFGGGAAARTAQNPGPVIFEAPGTFSVTLTVSDARGLPDPTPDTRIVFVRPNTPPQSAILSPAGDMALTTGRSVTFSGTGSDPDGHVPLSYAWSFGGGAPDQTVQNPGAVSFHTPGSFTVSFSVRDALGVIDPTPETRVITVSGSQNVVSNPSFESHVSGWGPYKGAALSRISGGPDGAWSLEVQGPSSTTDFGINDSPNWVSSTVAGAHYRVTALVRSASGRGAARLLVREYLGTVLVGPSAAASLALSPSWQSLSIDYVAQRSGATLDLLIVDAPAAAGEVFQVDAVTVQVAPPNIAGSTGRDPRPPRITRRVRSGGSGR